MIGVVLICWACTIKPRSPIRAGAVRTSNPTRILSLQLMLIQSNFKEENPPKEGFYTITRAGDTVVTGMGSTMVCI